MLTKLLLSGTLADTHARTHTQCLHLMSWLPHVLRRTNTVLKVPVSGLFAGFDVLTAVLLMNQVFLDLVIYV
jgi:hypothetical protein